jgi:hypothetical protein
MVMVNLIHKQSTHLFKGTFMNQYQLRCATLNKDTNSSDSLPVKSDINESTTSDETSEKEVLNDNPTGKQRGSTVALLFRAAESFEKNLRMGADYSAYLDLDDMRKMLDGYQKQLTEFFESKRRNKENT